MAINSRADLHVHSKYSDKPSEWILRRIGCPESFTDPHFLYRTARERGMDYVTITDHNAIGGALEIAHLPGVFLSEEVTAYFPEDRVGVHVVVLGITEAQHAEIQRLRRHLYDLVGYLRRERIAHFLAHPLYNVNPAFSLDHVEKLLLLFEVIEARNGGKGANYNTLARALVDRLTPEVIDRLANKHGLQPVGEEPWKKGLVGGVGRSRGAVHRRNLDGRGRGGDRGGVPPGDRRSPESARRARRGVAHTGPQYV